MVESTVFSPPTRIDLNAQGYGLAHFGSSREPFVMFYTRAVDDPIASTQKGIRVCKNVVHVKIEHPGEQLNKIDRPANDEDKQRYRDQWSRFVQNRTQIPDGTPIDILFPNHPATAENLRALGVYTIQQCAGLSAHAIDNIGRGGQEYVNRAKRYLDSAEKGAAFHQLQKDNDDLRQQIRIQEGQLAQMKSQLDMVMTKLTDPIRGANSPPFIPDYDVQSERINAAQKDSAKQTMAVINKPFTIEDRLTDPLLNSPMQNDPDIMITEGQDK